MSTNKIVPFFASMFFFFLFFAPANAQKNKEADAVLKDSIYNANKSIVLNFSMKQFDALFFEFFDKKVSPKVLLSKQEFYFYTIRIGIFSDRLATLYPDQKEIAAESKKKWFSETYEDYLVFKASQKK